MSDETELLPCPFCGGDYIKVESSPHMHWSSVSCGDCAARLPCDHAEEDAVKAWNARTYDAERIRHLVAKQAKDDGIWFISETAPEAYLQNEIRKLHAAIEGTDDFWQPLPSKPQQKTQK